MLRHTNVSFLLLKLYVQKYFTIDITICFIFFHFLGQVKDGTTQMKRNPLNFLKAHSRLVSMVIIAAFCLFAAVKWLPPSEEENERLGRAPFGVDAASVNRNHDATIKHPPNIQEEIRDGEKQVANVEKGPAGEEGANVVQTPVLKGTEKNDENSQTVLGVLGNPDSGKMEIFQKIVHLDLKGAPPKASYYEELFPLLSRYGASGLLIEYEDMFPYNGELEIVAADNAYTVTEIKQILELAKSHRLTVIPLIQSFGHMEYVLKHSTFAHLREVPESPQGCHAIGEETLKVIHAMIDQVLELHPNVKNIHIGGDEVYTMGKSQESKQWMKKENRSKDELYLHHMLGVLKHVRDQYPSVIPIMWDDGLRNIDAKTLVVSYNSVFPRIH